MLDLPSGTVLQSVTRWCRLLSTQVVTSSSLCDDNTLAGLPLEMTEAFPDSWAPETFPDT